MPRLKNWRFKSLKGNENIKVVMTALLVAPVGYLLIVGAMITLK